MATKVTLRQKPISKGRKSLYLDFYPPITVAGLDKPTRREFLGLYIIDNPKNPLEKLGNKETLLVAEQIRQKRENELTKPEVYNAFEIEQLKAKEKGELSFIAYFEQLMEKRIGKNYDVWFSSLFYLKEFTKGSLKFIDLNEKFCNDYREYLLKTKSRRTGTTNLSQNTAHSYFNKFKATVKQAFKDSLIPIDLNGKIEPIKEADSNRLFLSMEELNQLAKTDCPNPILKQASLFSALTGLRFSDIEKLTWSEVVYKNGQGYFIYFQQKKTKSNEYLPISEQAYTLLGTRKEANHQVFEGLVYSAHQNTVLLKWAMTAGIQKHLTFHSFRHTYAVLQLQAGTDIYTISKMLGHRELKTTQVYAKIVDETKRKATDKIILNFNQNEY
ncbi:site-specific integrase [Flavobacterium gilvum]|uniref:Integrase n=1 Tax=Flavobacterium gilvum TaxID=1492737 RepID=A0AAC9I792_9FLAO|nr:site-specific integrase [Flavobacterium gilvum]AOW10043.1 integrase [Flavobacterium gilvum]KFC58894.1 integrase [Flavobacterium gilvum]